MRFERLIMTSGPHAVAMRFHARFTVIAGLGPLERESITSELLGALGGPRPGTNLEIASDAGQRVAILRPGQGRDDRVVDTGSGADMSEDFTTPDGRLDLLTPHGLTVAAARRTCRLSSFDLMAQDVQDSLVATLASQPQGLLWRAADRLAAARNRVETTAAGVGATLEDTALVAEIDACHEQFDAAQERFETIRHNGIFTGGACALGGIPAVAMNRFAALPFALVAATFLILSVVFRRRMEVAGAVEDHALVAAGASTYGTFLYQRVSAMLGSREENRRAIFEAVAEHRRAQAGWSAMAGDVDLEWAFRSQSAIVASAARGGDAEGAALARALLRTHQPDRRELAELLLGRVDTLRSVGMVAESIPLILDEPFEGLDRSAKRWLLELLVRTAGRPQIVLLSADPDVVAWAQAEAVDGELGVVLPERDGRPPASPAASAGPSATPLAPAG